LLQFEQAGDYEAPITSKGYSLAYGTVSDVVIVITDYAGQVRTYYQDLRVELETLPKYGTLSVTAPINYATYGNWPEAFEVQQNSNYFGKDDGIIGTRPGGGMNLGICYGHALGDSNGVSQASVGPYLYCMDRYGQGPSIGHVDGPIAERNLFLRGEKVVIYRPYEGFLGPDYFKYSVYDGINKQMHKSFGGSTTSTNEVNIHVRKCRKFIADFSNLHVKGVSPTKVWSTTVHPLCTCSSTESLMVGNVTQCNAARSNICNILPSNKNALAANAVTGTRDRFRSMCLACTSLIGGTFVTKFTHAECVAQTMRAISQLTVRGMCSTEPSMDCTTEVITKGGPDRWEYLSLMPPTSDEEFSTLGNSIGNQGSYRSAPLN